jgi:hypothetical protein
MNVATAPKRRSRWIIASAAILSVLILAVFAAEAYLGPLAKAIVLRQAAPVFGDGLKVGTIDISLWRGSIIIREVRLAQPKRFEPGDLLQTSSIRVRTELLPLFRQQLIVKSIVIDRPEINLIQAADGDLNLSDYLAKFAAKPAAASGADPSFGVRLDQFRINGGRFSFSSPRLTPRRPAFLLTDSRLDLRHLNLPNPNHDVSPFAFRATIASKHPARLRVEGNGVFGGGSLRFNANTRISDLELADFAFLYPDSSVTVQSGRVWVVSNAECHDNYLFGRQQVEVKNLKLASKKGGWLGAVTLGLPAQGFAKFIADRRGALSFDFEVAGDFQHLKANYKTAIGTAIARSLRAKLGVLAPVGDAGTKAADGLKGAGHRLKDSLKKALDFKK